MWLLLFDLGVQRCKKESAYPEKTLKLLILEEKGSDDEMNAHIGAIVGKGLSTLASPVQI